MSLSTLKKSDSLDKLLGAVQAENQPQEKKSYVDERLWKPVLDKVGNGYAVIRFLPAPDGEDMPWARYGTMRFKVRQDSGILRTLSPHLARKTLYQK